MKGALGKRRASFILKGALGKTRAHNTARGLLGFHNSLKFSRDTSQHQGLIKRLNTWKATRLNTGN